MTLRLLWPQEQSRSRGKARETLSDARTCVTSLSPQRSPSIDMSHRRSFVYFGDGEPCAMLGSSGTEPIAPQWGPRIPVWPQVPENDIYTFWQLRLLSMTLLKPLRDDPDYRVDSHWESIEIEMPTVPGSHRGAETILDTCEFLKSALSLFACLVILIRAVFRCDPFPFSPGGHQQDRTSVAERSGDPRV